MGDVNVETAMLHKRCVICHIVFQEIHNTGDWHCCQHPGQIVDNHFTCCNLYTAYDNTQDFHRHTISTSRLGCVKSDHRTMYAPFDKTNGVNYVPNWFAHTVRGKYHALELRTVNGEAQLHVYRFDSKRADENTQKVAMHNLAKRKIVDESYILHQNLSIK